MIHVSCGARHTLALCEGAEVFSWGDNSFGQLGYNTELKLCHTPTRVTVLDGVPVIQVFANIITTFCFVKPHSLCNCKYSSFFGQLNLCIMV